MIRLRADGTLDTRFGSQRRRARLARRAARSGSRRWSATARAASCSPARASRPRAWSCACARAAAATSTFGNSGITYPLLGRPPGGDPIYTTLDAIDANGSRAIIAGSAAGPGQLIRGGAAGTIYTGRFALTVSKLK